MNSSRDAQDEIHTRRNQRLSAEVLAAYWPVIVRPEGRDEYYSWSASGDLVLERQ